MHNWKVKNKNVLGHSIYILLETIFLFNETKCQGRHTLFIDH